MSFLRVKKCCARVTRRARPTNVAARNRSLYDSGTVFVLSLRHRVRDFDSWKRVFDERLDARLKGKVTSHRPTRSTTDP
jgi:hypothetical protein